MNDDTNSIDELATALSQAQAEMPNAVFNRINPHFKSQYADLSAIRDASLPALTKHGLSIWQGTRIIDGGLVSITRLMHKSGQHLDSEWPIPVGRPQQMGSDLTYAKRYGWSSAIGLTADDDDDANAAEAMHGKHANGPRPEKKSAHKARKDGDWETKIAELRAIKTINGLNVWWAQNTEWREALPDNWQVHLREEGERIKAEIEEGVTEDGKPAGVKAQLKASLDAETA